MEPETLNQIARNAYSIPPSGFFNEWQFKKDFKTFYVIRKMINRYVTTGQMNYKLLLNNFVIAINAFSPCFVNQMLSVILTKDQICVALGFLEFLSCVRPEKLSGEPDQVVLDILHDLETRVTIIHN